MKLLTGFLGLLVSVFAFGSTSQAGVRPVIVMVPGFFNSLSVDPYFAQIIVDTIHARGLDVVAVDNLSSVGSVEENSDRLYTFIMKTSAQFPGRKMVLLGHSAGGLYSLLALTKHPELPVETLVSIGTPFGGVEFVDNLTTHVPGLDSLVKFIHLDSMREFGTKRMGAVLEKIRVPDKLRLIALAAYQPPCLLIGCARAENLSWVLSVAQHLMSSPSDGVVTVSSALAKGVELKRFNGTAFAFERWDDFVIPLEHWEVVGEAPVFHLLGVVNTDYIKSVQVSMFNSLFERLEPIINPPDALLR